MIEKKLNAFVSFATPLASCIFMTCTIALVTLIHPFAPIPTLYNILNFSLILNLANEVMYSLTRVKDDANIRNKFGFQVGLLTLIIHISFFLFWVKFNLNTLWKIISDKI